jgi:hypothetical protein
VRPSRTTERPSSTTLWTGCCFLLVAARPGYAADVRGSADRLAAKPKETATAGVRETAGAPAAFTGWPSDVPAPGATGTTTCSPPSA